MNWFENIYNFFQLFFNKLSFRTKPDKEIYDENDGEYEYEFMPINYEFVTLNEKMER